MNTGLANTVLTKLMERGGEFDAHYRLPGGRLCPHTWSSSLSEGLAWLLPQGSTPLSPNVGPGKKNLATLRVTNQDALMLY